MVFLAFVVVLKETVSKITLNFHVEFFEMFLRQLLNSDRDDLLKVVCLGIPFGRQTYGSVGLNSTCEYVCHSHRSRG